MKIGIYGAESKNYTYDTKKNWTPFWLTLLCIHGGPHMVYLFLLDFYETLPEYLWTDMKNWRQPIFRQRYIHIFHLKAFLIRFESLLKFHNMFPRDGTDIFRNIPHAGIVRYCREMSGNVGKCRGNVGKCREMSGNVGATSRGGPSKDCLKHSFECYKFFHFLHLKDKYCSTEKRISLMNKVNTEALSDTWYISKISNIQWVPFPTQVIEKVRWSPKHLQFT